MTRIANEAELMLLPDSLQEKLMERLSDGRYDNTVQAVFGLGDYSIRLFRATEDVPFNLTVTFSE